MSKCKLTEKMIGEALDQWDCLVEQAYEIFGVDCLAFYLSKKTASSNTVDDNDVPINSINSRRRVDGDYEQADKFISSEEVSDTLRVRIYWNAKEWRAVYGYTTVPENQVMILAKLEDADKLSQAIRIEYTDEYGKVYSFNKVSEPVPYSFKKDKYCSSIWEQDS